MANKFESTMNRFKRFLEKHEQLRKPSDWNGSEVKAQKNY